MAVFMGLIPCACIFLAYLAALAGVAIIALMSAPTVCA
jgi:hypothetical protein